MSAITVITDDIRQRMIAELTSPGGPFEVTNETIRGLDYKVFKSSPRNLREMYSLGMDTGSFYARVFINWFGDQDCPCMIYKDECYSFEETYQLAAQLAWRMKELYGIEKGDRVAIAMRNYPEFCLAFMASTAIGAMA